MVYKNYRKIMLLSVPAKVQSKILLKGMKIAADNQKQEKAFEKEEQQQWTGFQWSEVIG